MLVLITYDVNTRQLTREKTFKKSSKRMSELRTKSSKFCF